MSCCLAKNKRASSGVVGLVAILLALSLLLYAQGPPEKVSILVHLEPGADRGPVRAFAANRGGHVRYEYTVLPNVVNVRDIPAGALSALEQAPGVVRLEEDLAVHAHLNDSVPHIRGLQSQITGAGFTADGTGIRVCIADTGIDSDHSMYSGRIDAAAGFDFVNNDPRPRRRRGPRCPRGGNRCGRNRVDGGFRLRGIGALSGSCAGGDSNCRQGSR